MKIGMDVSIAECRVSGYTVIDFKVRELYPNGRNNPMDLYSPVYVTLSVPENWNDSGRPMIGCNVDELYCYDTCISWDACLELYMEYSIGVDSIVGREVDDAHNPSWDKVEPNEYNLLAMIDECIAYGLID